MAMASKDEYVGSHVNRSLFPLDLQFSECNASSSVSPLTTFYGSIGDSSFQWTQDS